ncbi:KHG/KDPG aldolase [Pirellula sp. SH-Sr6A]|uniref:bifunctional 4-hydroxy-2-oxoglutarate aldolase/2-dehydro-3-deoxy-phosphogluconate aldolase n=1 Tax=Pirellula sp. SH-Sr6A TaxID=1632865 RepID=UPI00078DE1A1|nr:bifunctional 4-hydroxy-2-oxoglutarate aldolase/2-dehydro-3-deoxy-phosphogluconate aldolase [Pirellula sp. SH-Sr6A]AMV35510.1 KHG/KDPG aldolase [Pirellula sp. SH-Sr6A]
METPSLSRPTSIILDSRLVAILRLSDLQDALPLVESLLSGGVRALEFTLTNPDSPRVVSECLKHFDELTTGNATIGLGSVRNVEEAKRAVDCGAQFVVSPITDLRVMEYCHRFHIPTCPGAYTPTEIALAHEAGAGIVKVFPARNLGPEYIRDVLAPMPYLRLMPTGGIDLQNVMRYFRSGAVAVGVGGQFLNPTWIQEKNWASIRDAASQFAAACVPAAASNES